jgi:hypothetical protein
VQLAARLTDTSPMARAIQLNAIREMTGQQRIAIMLDLTETALAFSKAGLRHRYPDASADEIDDRLFTLCHGEALAAKYLPHRAAHRARLRAESAADSR